MVTEGEIIIQQGEVYWVDLGTPRTSEPGYHRPGVIIQNNAFNRSRIATTVICTLSSQLSRANAPGNVLLNPGEGHLPHQSVVIVSQIFTVDKTQIEERIGTLSTSRVRQILDGLRMLTEPE